MGNEVEELEQLYKGIDNEIIDRAKAIEELIFKFNDIEIILKEKYCPPEFQEYFEKITKNECKCLNGMREVESFTKNSEILEILGFVPEKETVKQIPDEAFMEIGQNIKKVSNKNKMLASVVALIGLGSLAVYFAKKKGIFEKFFKKHN